MHSNDLETYILEGNLDIGCEEFFKTLPAKVARPRVCFDFGRVKRINSMGVALILRCFKQIREERQAEIVLTGLAPMHSMLFKMTGVLLLATPLPEGGSTT